MENSQPKKFYQKKWFWIVAGIVAVIWIGSSTPSKTPSSDKTQPATATKAEAKPEAIKVTASTLAKAYADNEVAADQKYKGKTVEVSGTVKDIGVMLGNAFVILEGNQILSDIQCFFDRSQDGELASLKKGTSIVLRGEVDGKSLNVGVKDCEIVK